MEGTKSNTISVLLLVVLQKTWLMIIHHRLVFLFILCLFFSSGCHKDDEFIDVDHNNTAEDTYPFKRGSIIAEDTAQFNFLKELFGYSSQQ